MGSYGELKEIFILKDGTIIQASGRNSGVECLLPKQNIPRLANQIHDCPYSVGVRG